jgi:hypothetical protein
MSDTTDERTTLVVERATETDSIESDADSEQIESDDDYPYIPFRMADGCALL